MYSDLQILVGLSTQHIKPLAFEKTENLEKFNYFTFSLYFDKNHSILIVLKFFYKMKRNSYDRLRKVVMAGWFVGVFCFVFFSFSFSFFF